MFVRRLLQWACFVLVILLTAGLSEVSATSNLEGDWEIDGTKEVSCDGELPKEVLTKAEDGLMRDFRTVTITQHQKGRKQRWIFEYQDFSVVSKKKQNVKGVIGMKRFVHPVNLYDNTLTLHIRATVQRQADPNRLLVEAPVTGGKKKNSPELFKCTFHYVRPNPAP